MIPYKVAFLFERTLSFCHEARSLQKEIDHFRGLLIMNLKHFYK